MVLQRGAAQGAGWPDMKKASVREALDERLRARARRTGWRAVAAGLAQFEPRVDSVFFWASAVAVVLAEDSSSSPLEAFLNSWID